MTIYTRQDPQADGPMLTRAVGIDFEEESLGERLITGYASIFNEKDSYDDIILPGAFEQTLDEEFPKKRIKFLYQHDWSCPLGVPHVLEEREKGLWGEVNVINTSRGDDALIEARAQAVDGLSIGFWVRQSRLVDDDGEPLDESEASWLDYWMAHREIINLKLGEYSLVTFPAAENARVDEVRMARRQIEYAEKMSERAGKSPQFGEAHLAELVTELRSLNMLIRTGMLPGKKSAPPEEAQEHHNPASEKNYQELQRGLDELNAKLKASIAQVRTS